MADNSSITQVLQLGAENTGTPGTVVAATKRMQTLMVDWSPKPQVDLFRPSGNKWSTVAAFNKEWSEGKISGKPSFAEMAYLFASILNSTTPSAAGANGAQKWTFTPGSTTADTLQTYTIESGNAFRARQFGFSYINQAGLKFTRDAVDLSGNIMAQALTDGFTLTPLTGVSDIQTVTITGTPTGGTFTLAFLGAVTAPIAYNATAAAVTAALVALSTIGAGGVTVTGGPGPGTPWVVTFAAQNALAFQPLMVAVSAGLTGGASPTATPTHTTPGVGVTPEGAINPIIPPQIDFYVDLTSGAIGTTKFTKAFEVDWMLDNRLAPVWALNSAVSGYSGVVEVEPKPQLKATVEVDAQGMALLPYLRAGTTIFTRIQATGPLIDGTLAYRLRIDQAVKLKSTSEFKDHAGVYALEFDGQTTYDQGYAKAITVELQNLLPALA